MVCVGNVHDIDFEDPSDPAGNECGCGKLSVFSATSTVREGVVGISVIVDEGDD